MEKVNEIKPKETISVFEGGAIITGYGIGAGVLTMPALANKIGIWMTILIMAVAYLGCYLLHIMIADLTIKTGKNSQVVDILSKYIFKGKAKKVLTIICFIILSIVLYANLAAYISGAAGILTASIPAIPEWAFKLIFYVFAAVVALFGLKILGVTEKYAVILILAMAASLMVGSCFHITNSLKQTIDSFPDVLNFFSIAMFAFSGFFSIPQVATGLNGDRKKVKLSIHLGMCINAVIMILVIIFCALSTSDITQKDCVIGWSAGIGDWAKVIGCIFTVFAMLTTYWSLSMALKDTVKNQLKLNDKISWLIATLPSLGVALIPIDFSTFVNIAGGAIAILIAAFVIPSFIMANKEKDTECFINKKIVIPAEITAIILFIFMAVGSIVGIFL